MFEPVVRRAARGARRAGAAVPRDALHRRPRRVARRGAGRSRSTRSWRTATPPIETTILAAPGQIELHLDAAIAGRGRGRRARSRAARDEIARPCSATTSSAPTAADRGGRRRSCCERGADDRRGRVVHRRAADVAADRRPGSSAYVERRRRGLQQRDEGRAWLGVPAALIAAHGAVSEPVRSRWPKAFARGPAPSRRRHHRHRRTAAAGRRRSRSARWRSRSLRRRRERVRTFPFHGRDR